MVRFLCFDPKKDFSHFLQKSAIDTCKSEEDAQDFLKKTKKEDYDAFVLIEQEPFQESLSLLKKIQHENTPSIFFVTRHKTAAEFEKLKKEFGVDFVLETPFDIGEIQALIHAIVHKPPSAPIEGLSEAHVKKYQASIFDKIKRIEQLILEIEENPQLKDALIDLRNEVHKIAGSAASYGYTIVSKACKVHELFLYNFFTKEEALSKEEQKTINQVNRTFLRKLRLNFQQIDVKVEELTEIDEESKPDENQVLLITSDLALTQFFQEIAERYNYPLQTESNPNEFLKKCEVSSVQASIIIVEEYFPFTTTSGFEIIQKLKQKVAPQTEFGILSESDDLAKRIDWLERSINLILKKPLTERNVLQVFRQTEKDHLFPKIRALIVDDDPDVADIEKTLLEEMQINALYLNDERRLMKVLEEFSPQLLILDISLPHIDGEKLLDALRADVRYQRLIIVLVTAFKERVEEVDVYKKNCDSIIYKPIPPAYFKSRIANLLTRHATIELQSILDPVTNVYKKEYFFQKVKNRIPMVKGGNAIFVLMHIDLWKNIIHTLSDTERKELLITLANAIKSYFEGKAIYGLLREALFILFFDSTSVEELQTLVNTFFTDMEKKIWLPGREDLRFTLSSGITLFTLHESLIDAALLQAKKALKEAEEAGGNRIAFKKLAETIPPADAKHLILVEDDQDLCNVISFMFQNQGFEVSVFNTGQEAIDYFNKMERLEENTLFILDRILPDRDGISLLQMLRGKFPGKVKAMFLTSLSSEEDILAGLKMGALDYIAKPFSVYILMQKALTLLKK